MYLSLYMYIYIKIFKRMGFRSAARSWNVCRYTHISNQKIHSVYIGLYLTDSRWCQCSSCRYCRNLSRPWLLQLVHTEEIPAHECARHPRDIDDVYTHAIHELITRPVRPPCATHALTRVEKRTPKRWTNPCIWHGRRIFQRPPCFEGGWESTGRYSNSGLPNISRPVHACRGFETAQGTPLKVGREQRRKQRCTE